MRRTNLLSFLTSPIRLSLHFFRQIDSFGKFICVDRRLRHACISQAHFFFVLMMTNPKGKYTFEFASLKAVLYLYPAFKCFSNYTHAYEAFTEAADMSVSVNEINYLIWRYLQESGLEVSAYALEDETTINKLDSVYSPHVPLGCLVDLVQKGILYSKMTDLVSAVKTDTIMQDDIINLNFNFFTALHEINTKESTKDRKILSPEELEDSKIIKKEATEGDEKEIGETKKAPQGHQQVRNSATSSEQQQQALTPPTPIDPQQDKSDFIKVLKGSMEYDSSYSVSFSPNNPNLLAWSQRDSQSIIYSFTSSSQIRLPLPLACKETLIVSWSPSGSSLITASENGELRLWSDEGTLLRTLAMHHWPIVSAHWSPSGRYLLSLDIRNVAVVWDTTTSLVVAHLDKESWSHADKNFNDLISKEAVAKDFSQSFKNYGTDTCWLDDNKFVIPGPRYTLLVCQVMNDNSNNIIGVLTGHEESICCVKYDPRLRLLCSASEDGVIRIWKGNSTNSLQILTGHSLAVSMLDWINISGKWYLLSTALDGTMRIWDFVQNESVDLVSVDQGQAILCASLYHGKHQDRKLVATGDSSGSVCIWSIDGDSRNTIKLRQIGLYQHYDDNKADNQEAGFVSEISWNTDGSKIAVSFSVGKSVIIDIL